MVPNFGVMEIAIILVIALIIFGPKRLPELGRSLGRGINEFREGVSSIGQQDDDHDEDDEDFDPDYDAEPAELTPPPSDAANPLPGEEPEVTEVTGGKAASPDPAEEAEPVDGEVVPDSRD